MVLEDVIFGNATLIQQFVEETEMMLTSPAYIEYG